MNKATALEIVRIDAKIEILQDVMTECGSSEFLEKELNRLKEEKYNISISEK